MGRLSWCRVGVCGGAAGPRRAGRVPRRRVGGGRRVRWQGVTAGRADPGRHLPNAEGRPPPVRGRGDGAHGAQPRVVHRTPKPLVPPHAAAARPTQVLHEGSIRRHAAAPTAGIPAARALPVWEWGRATAGARGQPDATLSAAHLEPGPDATRHRAAAVPRPRIVQVIISASASSPWGRLAGVPRPAVDADIRPSVLRVLRRSKPKLGRVTAHLDSSTYSRNASHPTE